MCTQTTKSAGEGDGVFDSDLLTGNDDSLDQEPRQTLSAIEVEFVEPHTEGCRKCRQVIAQPIETSPMHLFSCSLLERGYQVRSGVCQSFTLCLRLVHSD